MKQGKVHPTKWKDWFKNKIGLKDQDSESSFDKELKKKYTEEVDFETGENVIQNL